MPVKGLRFLTAPLQFLWGMVMWAVVLFLSPIIFFGLLVFGFRSMSPDEIGLMKVLLVVLGPFAFDFWWIIIGHFSGRYRAKLLIAERNQSGDDYTEEDLEFLEQVRKPHHLRNFAVLMVSFVGSACAACLSLNGGDWMFFFAVLAGIFSPAIIVGAWKLMRKFV